MVGEERCCTIFLMCRFVMQSSIRKRSSSELRSNQLWRENRDTLCKWRRRKKRKKAPLHHRKTFFFLFCLGTAFCTIRLNLLRSCSSWAKQSWHSWFKRVANSPIQHFWRALCSLPKITPTNYVQGNQTGCRTGNGGKLSNSRFDDLTCLCLAAAYFLSIS